MLKMFTIQAVRRVESHVPSVEDWTGNSTGFGFSVNKQRLKKKRRGYFKEEISWLTSSWPFGETWPLICPSTWLVSCSYWILATMLFFGECTLNFKHRSFQSLPVERQVRRLQKKSGVISGKKKKTTSLDESQGIWTTKKVGCFGCLGIGRPTPSKKLSPVPPPFCWKKKYMAFSPSWIG